MRWGPAGVRQNQERNNLLKAWLAAEEDKSKDNPAGQEGRIKAGPFIDLGNYEYDREDLYTRPFRSHLTREGYIKVTKDFVLQAESDFVKCEFQVFTSNRGRS